MNLEQLNAMTDLELDEAVALAQGADEYANELAYKDGINMYLGGNHKYHPTANTTEGKSAAFDLMVKYEIDTVFLSSTNEVFVIGGKTRVTARDENPQRAIVIAAILSAQEKGL